jgi:hypothetical protein
VSPARFAAIANAAVDGADNIYVGDCSLFTNTPTPNSLVRQVGFGGEVVSIAGDGTAGYTNGVGKSATLDCPRGLATNPNGDVIFTDFFTDNTVRGLKPNGLVYPIAGDAQFGNDYADGVGGGAHFAGPVDTAVDAAGNIYVADLYNCAIREILPGNAVTTLADLRTNNGLDTTGAVELCPTRFESDPSTETTLSLEARSMSFDGNDLIVAVNDLNALVSVIERVTISAGEVSVKPIVGCLSSGKISAANNFYPDFSGQYATCAEDIAANGREFASVFNNVNPAGTPCLQASLRNPRSVLATANDSLLIADDQVIDLVQHASDPAQCTIKTLVGTAHSGVALGPLAGAGFNLLRGLALTRSGDIVAVDEDEGVVLLVRYN